MTPQAGIPQRLCACGTVLTKRQKVACTPSCRAKRMHALHPQRGAGNFNFKGWRSKHPTLYTSEFKRRNPEKVQAHWLVAYAIRKGHIVRPAACSSCLKPCRPDAHHEDYSKALAVEWLCRKCHAAADRLRAARQSVPVSVQPLAVAAPALSAFAAGFARRDHVIPQERVSRHAQQSARTARPFPVAK